LPPAPPAPDPSQGCFMIAREKLNPVIPMEMGI
jgi:hypothetical protein